MKGMKLPENLPVIEDVSPLLERARVMEEDIEGVRIVSAFLEEANLSALTFKGCVLEGCRLIGCDMHKAIFLILT